MYIIAIAWLYVTILMAASEASVTAAIATFLIYGLFPLSVLLYLMGTPQRRRNRLAREQSQHDAAPHATDEATQSSVLGYEPPSSSAPDASVMVQAKSGKPGDR